MSLDDDKKTCEKVAEAEAC